LQVRDVDVVNDELQALYLETAIIMTDLCWPVLFTPSPLLRPHLSPTTVDHAPFVSVVALLVFSLQFFCDILCLHFAM